MKIRILSILVSLIIITSFGANALNRETMKKDNFNGWWYDKDTQHDYYFKNGESVVGWFNNSNKWYYANENGELQTRWVNINNNWYYFNKTGAMQTGWLQDSVGKWYYLNSDGTMAHNTTVDGCKLGSDGVWIK
ncbi:hypothetical protein [Clostridium beijerinckii]|uniref:hypothetical protein n=1 Tax=Clostridium beijerinckii TaxID=1520 RepID=UPI001F42B51C|nr:hypothetical protein [Clostridium beijerinckii]